MGAPIAASACKDRRSSMTPYEIVDRIVERPIFLEMKGINELRNCVGLTKWLSGQGSGKAKCKETLDALP